MMAKIISGLLILITVFFGLSHGARAFQKPSVEYLEMMNTLGITEISRIIIGCWTILSAILILFPKTFFIGSIGRAILLLIMISLALKAGNYKFALIEIPFLLMPLVLIYLGHPFKNGF
ncbi:MAG: DoxX family protein [Bacteroidales bacterium]